ncbi:MAG TPA: DCC1-like thiol-disulfide oxidoreductase family protein [Xanthobacteraceae bacterium]|nr:DCC1-like thiol-disulfide oxidoreductase family protein [Xanthobacteraceae bacterium]
MSKFVSVMFVSVLRPIGNVLRAVMEAWTRFWFTSAPTTPLEITRIGVGLALLINYALATPYLLTFWGVGGWVPLAQIFDNTNDWTHSLHFHLTQHWELFLFHGLFLFCCASLMLGWRTSWVKWVVLIGQVSYAQRNPVLVYGIDKILCSLLVILCVAPIGRAISLDRLRLVRAAKRVSLAATVPPFASPWANACTRLMQIQMAVLFFYSALEKIRGNEWWDGDAIWIVFSNNDIYNGLLLSLFAHQYWLVNVATYTTLLIEIAYPFLIWQRATRPYFLAAAIFLHLNFGTFMGMPYFSFVMIMGHMSFVRPEWLFELGQWWKRKIGAMEMIYDGRCGFCIRSMAWFLAFDGLAQINVRDFRTNPSPVVSDALVEKALYLVLPDGRALPGFEAYRHVVLRVPGLWWQVPFFYIPVVSRLVGHPIYNWVASNRSWLSSFRMKSAPAQPS